jgi:hypothetical protein
MAKNLDRLIAKVAMEVPAGDPEKATTAARDVAPQLTPEEAASLPAKWYPKVTAKAAGVPQLRDAWPRAWFEAIAEVLCHKGSDGLPALLELLARDNSTYHELVVLRLLRLAATGLQTREIVAKVAARLAEVHRTAVYAAVREVVHWSRRDPRPLELLRSMATVKVKNAEGDTVGNYIEQSEAELALAQMREAPRQATDAIDEEIVQVAVLGLDPGAFRTRAQEAADKLSFGAAVALGQRIQKPDLQVLQSRLPPTLSNHEAIWARSVLEILGHLGAPAVVPVRAAIDGGDDYVREKALRALCLLAARLTGAEQADLVRELEKRLPRLAPRDVRSLVRELVADAHADQAIGELLTALGDVKVKDFGNASTTVGDIARSAGAPPPPPANDDASKKRRCEEFARRFAATLVGEDFVSAQGMFCAALRKKYTPKKLKTLVAAESKHSGPPESFEYSDNNTTAAHLRVGGGDIPALPKHVTDRSFVRWCCLQFLPAEESDVDACFDFWMAVMEEDGELKVGFCHILNPD